MIRLVTGPLGTGKSYYGVRKACDAIREGRLVVTNFALSPDWIDQAVRHGYVFKHRARLDERVALAERRYLRVRSLEELMRVRVAPVEPHSRPVFHRDGSPWITESGTQLWQPREGAAVIILDEAHRWMNARSWSREGREQLLNYFALARKRGFVIYLIAQRAENMDVQVRELFEDHIRLNNLKRSVRVWGIPIVPFNAFIASWWSHHYPDFPNKYERYRLDYRRHLYDTMETASFGGLEQDAVASPLLLPGPVDGHKRTDGTQGG
jgi:hypothetical protein